MGTENQRRMIMMLLLVWVILVLGGVAAQVEQDSVWVTRNEITNQDRKLEIGKHSRFVLDGALLDDSQVHVLVNMVDKALDPASKNRGGPVILDINSGFIRDSTGGIRNIYPDISYTQEEYKLYGSVFETIRKTVKSVNHLNQELYFTAPTFIARIVGSKDWKPKDMHDEYYHTHVDKDNTDHYDYSALVYLSTYGTNFTGGEFVFNDQDKDVIVEPRAGRLVSFSSGKENPHQVRLVRSGIRYAISCWFTLDKTKQFENFLDGKAHHLHLHERNEKEL